jgi:hypothetical protein
MGVVQSEIQQIKGEAAISDAMRALENNYDLNSQDRVIVGAELHNEVNKIAEEISASDSRGEDQASILAGVYRQLMFKIREQADDSGVSILEIAKKYREVYLQKPDRNKVIEYCLDDIVDKIEKKEVSKLRRESTLKSMLLNVLKKVFSYQSIKEKAIYQKKLETLSILRTTGYDSLRQIYKIKAEEFCLQDTVHEEGDDRK